MNILCRLQSAELQIFRNHNLRGLVIQICAYFLRWMNKFLDQLNEYQITKAKT